MGTSLLESVRLLANSSLVLADKTVSGLEANVERAAALAGMSPSIVTPLNRIIGYEAAAQIAKHSVKAGITVRDAVIELGYVERGEISLEQLDAALNLLSMTKPGVAG
jgi:fumarate hydratase class II